MSKQAITCETTSVETLTLQTILRDASGILRQGDPASLVRNLTTSSRQAKSGDLFVALKGDRFDGHDFVEQSARQGAGGAIVKQGWFAPVLPDSFAVIEVGDVLQAYQQIAASYRRSLPLKVIAITGSNGKTSTKDFTAAVLEHRFQVMKTQGNLNNHIGVPQTLLSAGADDQFAVLELGMNHPGEIAPLAAMALPDTAIITNIGTAHIEFMKTRAAIAQEKGTLAEAIDNTGHVILPAEDDFAASIAQRTSAQIVTVGLHRGDLRADSVVGSIHGSHFQLVEGDIKLDVRLPVPGLHMVVNALLGVAAGRIHGMSLHDCAAGLEAVQLTKGRLEWKRVAGLQILDDSYNANPDSMVAALQTLARMPTDGRRIAVLGRMGELGDHSEAGHRRVGDAVASERIDFLITVGPEAEHIAENARTGGVREIAAVADVAEAAQWLEAVAHGDDLVLIKGSRSAAMENIISALTHLRADSVTHPIS